MVYHTFPKDDAWKQCTIGREIEEGHTTLSVWCNACGHECRIGPAEFAERHGIPLHTPILLIKMRLVCSACGERKGGIHLLANCTLHITG